MASTTPAAHRIAVVDDEAPTTLVRYLNNVGFEARHFSEAGPVHELLDTPDRPDGYVLDWTLSHGQTSRGLIEAIREVDPSCPILLLTGTIQSKQANESEIAQVIGMYDVAIYEKPTRLRVLADKLSVMLGAPVPAARTEC